jgi:hypothetical protein
MARKATPSRGAARKTAKPAAKKAVRKPARAKATPKAKRAVAAKRAVVAKRAPQRPSNDMTAGEALVKLIESPLVADLLAVGATAALAAIAGHKFSGTKGTGNAVKAAGKAAASAMGQRISTEVEGIRKASKARDAGRG